MKKRQVYLSLLLLIVLCFSCTGCSTISTLLLFTQRGISGGEAENQETEIYHEMVEKLFSALDAGNEASVRALFSVHARQRDPDFEADLDRLMELYSGPTDALGQHDMLAGSYSTEYGVNTAEVYTTFPVVSAGEYYWCHLQLMYRNDADEDQVGISQLLFYSAEEFYLLHSDENRHYPDEAGLFVYDEYTLEGEIRSINGWPCRFTPIDRVIDEEEVKVFLDRSNLYSEFVEQFGEPNGGDSYLYYYYELQPENGQPRYLEMSVEERSNKIVYAAVVDNFGWLYKIWEE